MKHTQIARLRGSSALSALVLAGSLFAAPAFAQDASTPGQTQVQAQTEGHPDAQTDDQQSSGEIVVTGSLFRRTDTETPSPVTVVTNETLSRAGTTTIADAIRQVSADGAGSIGTGFQAGFSAGGSAVSLRGLGVSSTLILIDGLRSANFPLNDDGHNAYVDLNSIPFSVVDRIEVLKDGASSTYGAEAIGGVVNVILKKQFTGLTGTIEGGAADKGYGARYRGNLTAGFGDYEATGWNFYVNGEYQRDSAISGRDVGFPYNTTDLSSIGLLDQNADDSSITGTSNNGTVDAVVARTTQGDLNNPFTGGLALTPSGTYVNADGATAPYSNFTLLSPNCLNGTFTVAGGANRGTGCRHNTTSEYSQVQPFQERFSFTGRLSIRLSDNVEAYVLGTYSHSQVNIAGTAPSIRQRQPYGASPTVASNNPGVVLPYYVCAAGTNCFTAADRRLNPNNPYATVNGVDAATAAANAARIYYRFGDIYNGSERGNELIRGAIGLNGSINDSWDWRVEAVGARDNLELNQFGTINIAGLQQAINTGAYNFRNPALNTDAVRQQIAPDIQALSHTSLASLDASISHAFFQLPGGPFQVAIGGQIRRETLENNSLNPVLANYANTAAAFGAHTVSAAYFEVSAPIVTQLEVTGSGRYDHYSEGFSHFSPKVGFKFTPVKQLAIRGTYSEGFRAPTFAESNPRSSFPGFVTFTPPASFQLAHGGLVSNGNTNPYAQAYSVGGGFSGNPDLKPETSRSFTGGVVFEPIRNLSFTVDYYNIKKSDVIVAGPNLGAARSAYFSGQPLPAGYTVGAVDAIDPLYPTALPRVLIINAPYVNAGYFKTEGLDFSANANFEITDGVRFISRLDVNKILKFNVDFGDGITRKYVGTLGPYELSSGAGTPEWRGNWQNTLELGDFSVSATTYYVSRIKEVAADEYDADANGNIDLSCANNLYGTDDDACYIKKFIYTDVNLSYRVNDSFTFFGNIGNIGNAKAPIAPASYSGVNYLPTWHYAGVVGRTFRAGASFKF
jgi:iron complex outermembrane recepter protein